MPFRRAVPLIVGGALVAAGCTLPAPSGAADPRHTLKVDGRTRSYRLHLPAGAPAGPRPLVILFHGRGGTGAAMARLTGFGDVADRAGAIAAYPDGVRRSWADGLDTPATRAGVDDVAFTQALIARISADRPVDPRRVYAAGMSNGAMLTELLGCRLADRLAAIAPVAGPLPQPLAAGCLPAAPLPVVAIHGDADPIVPYAGGAIAGGSGSVLSAPATLAHWAARGGCGGPVTSTSLPPLVTDGTSVTLQRASGCAAGAAAELYTVAGGGHTWPGGRQYLPALLIGKTSRQLDASQAIWDFFAAHPR